MWVWYCWKNKIYQKEQICGQIYKNNECYTQNNTILWETDIYKSKNIIRLEKKGMGKLWDIVQNITKAKLKLGCNNLKMHIETSTVNPKKGNTRLCKI